MRYNFESIAEDLLMAADKKLESHRKAVLKQMRTLFDFMGDKIQYDQRKQLEQVIDDLLNDGNKSHSALHIQTMNKIIRSIKEVIHEA